MYIQLKQNETFTNPDTGQEFANIVAGVKNINITVDENKCTFLLKMFLSRDLMLEGKNKVYQHAFIIENTEDKTDFTIMYSANPNKGMFGLDMEKLMYDFIINQEGFNVFEKII